MEVNNLPTSTFFNLPQQKKERIIDAALDEFSESSYHQARVSNIVDNAGIAKGSFYQYFNNKKEIFKYIIDIMGEKKLKYLDEVIKKQPEMDFFDFLEELYKNGLEFAKDNPRLNKIGNKLFSDSNSEIFDEIMDINENKSIDFYENILGFQVIRRFAIGSEMAASIFGLTKQATVVLVEKEDLIIELFVTEILLPFQGYQHTCLDVDNRNEILEGCREKNFEVIKLEKEHHNLLFVKDKSENLFELKER